jgi:hypothetical protein
LPDPIQTGVDFFFQRLLVACSMSRMNSEKAAWVMIMPKNCCSPEVSDLADFDEFFFSILFAWSFSIAWDKIT